MIFSTAQRQPKQTLLPNSTYPTADGAPNWRETTAWPTQNTNITNEQLYMQLTLNRSSAVCNPNYSHQFGGSVSSSYSSSTSSLTSSKKSLENDNSVFHINWISTNSTIQGKENTSALKPRIIRAAPPKKSVLNKDDLVANCSPPMPKVPPPSPPKGNYDVVTPYGVALYDFPATQPGDLALQVCFLSNFY
jgi:hypothetical protein